VGIITKVVEVLFLMLSGFKFTEFFTGFRRWALLSAIAAVLLVPGLAVLGFLPSAQANPGKAAALPVSWKATSPSIRPGDQYTLVMKNTGDKAQQARVQTVIMDHRNHVNTPVIDEPVKLAPGEERELTADNDYGTANHFNTIIRSKTQDLALSVKVTDSAGNEKARFNQDAFMIQGA
jgi:hypothetical protein